MDVVVTSLREDPVLVFALFSCKILMIKKILSSNYFVVILCKIIIILFDRKKSITNR